MCDPETKESKEIQTMKYIQSVFEATGAQSMLGTRDETRRNNDGKFEIINESKIDFFHPDVWCGRGNYLFVAIAVDAINRTNKHPHHIKITPSVELNMYQQMSQIHVAPRIIAKHSRQIMETEKYEWTLFQYMKRKSTDIVSWKML